ncbi:MAG: hypothetical protein R3B07_14820 [Polyangiaceae bacterium]
MRFGFLWLAPALCVAVACGSDGGDSGGNNGGSGNGGNGGTAGGGTGGAGAEPSYATNGPGACNGSWRAANDDFCHADCTIDDCKRASQRPVDSCCVLVGEPGKGTSPNIVRTTDTVDYSDPTGAPPNLSCFAGDPPVTKASKLVTMKGIVEAFSNGCDLSNVKIEVYTVDNDPNSATYRDKLELIGTPVVTDDFEVVQEADDDCPDELVDNRNYVYADVPTYTELMVITKSSDESGAGGAPLWRTLYTYNLYITEDDPDFDAGSNTYTRDQRALADSDFQLIPTVALGSPISAGNGAIGGEVHDCDNIRIQNARVDINRTRAAVSYFNDDEYNPLPESGRNEVGTGRTAIWSALNVEPGVARVAATGLMDIEGTQTLVTLGYYDVRIYADAVTSVTFRGRRPFQ